MDLNEHKWDYRGQFSGGLFIYDCLSCGASVGVERGKCESIQQAMEKAGITTRCTAPPPQITLRDLTNRNDIGKVLDAMGLQGLGVEVGVAFGENAEAILSSSNLTKLFLIDPWDYVPGENPMGFADAIKDWKGCFDYCAAKVAPFGERAMMVRKSSAEALEGVPDGVLDFVYIDANHMRPMIDKDLAGWWPKVKKGGIFGGHDYHMVNRQDYVCEVKAAVDEFFADKGYQLHVTNDADPSWYVIK